MKGNQKAQKNIISDDKGLIQMLPVVGIAIIMLYAIMYVGTYINGTIGSQLIDTMPKQVKSGSVYELYWKNGSTSGYTNISLGCTIGELTSSASGFYINANSTQIIYNLTVNGNAHFINNSVEGTQWTNTTLATMIANSTAVSNLQYINLSWDIKDNNTLNQIKILMQGIYYTAGDMRTTFQNKSINTLENLSGDYDSNIEIVSVAAIITVLTIPLMAVVAVKKLL